MAKAAQNKRGDWLRLTSFRSVTGWLGHYLVGALNPERWLIKTDIFQVN